MGIEANIISQTPIVNIDVDKKTTAELDESFQEVVEEYEIPNNKELWLKKQINSLKIVLEKNPLFYRYFGAKWWAVKSILAKEIDWLGNNTDPIYESKYTYTGTNGEFYTLFNGVLEQSWNLDNTFESNHTFVISGKIENDTEVEVTYVLEDEDMELRRTNKNIYP